MMESGVGRRPIGERIHEFLESPKSKSANAVQTAIAVLIFASLAIILVEYRYEDVYFRNKWEFDLANDIVLVIFTVEYLARVLTAPNRGRYVRMPLNVVDFLAIAPNYLEIALNLGGELLFTTWVRGIRLIRFLRFFRILRALRLIRSSKSVKNLINYEENVIHAIIPTLVLLVAAKAVVWLFESYGAWMTNSDLGELFVVIGFALGIILSQKIGVTYGKFVQVQEASVRMFSGLQTLSLILEDFRPGLSAICRGWAREFLRILHDPAADNNSIRPMNVSLYRAIALVEKAAPDQFWTLHKELIADASFCLDKKIRLTPPAYDLLLEQSTLLYLLLISLFIPGMTGMISVIIATYVLYGMYYLTKDLDSIIGGPHNLINIDLSELIDFANEKDTQGAQPLK